LAEAQVETLLPRGRDFSGDIIPLRTWETLA
jgi:hypothetical protein